MLDMSIGLESIDEVDLSENFDKKSLSERQKQLNDQSNKDIN